jgi:hypothetical protein
LIRAVATASPRLNMWFNLIILVALIAVMLWLSLRHSYETGNPTAISECKTRVMWRGISSGSNREPDIVFDCEAEKWITVPFDSCSDCTIIDNVSIGPSRVSKTNTVIVQYSRLLHSCRLVIACIDCHLHQAATPVHYKGGFSLW